MAEAQKGTPSASNPKEKKSLFGEEEIGKEFLGSWKSMSLVEDDTLDFSFDNASTGKKKSFNFGNLDMDLNLDGDFSSFKVDMPDLDFSSPAKKSEKPKEKVGRETSSGNHRGKHDSFSFSFDFDALDSFKIDSSLERAEKTSANSKEVSADGSESQGSKLNLKGCNDSFEGRGPETIPTSEREMTSMVEGVTSDSGNENSLHDKSPSISGISGNLAVPHGEITFPDKTFTDSAEKAHPQSHILEKAMPTESDAFQRKEILPVQSVVGSNSTEDIVLDIQPESGSLDMMVPTGCGGAGRVDSQVAPGIGSDHANSDQSALHVTQSESNRGESENTDCEAPTERIIETEPIRDDLDLEATSGETLSETAPHDCKVNMDTQISSFKTLAPSRSVSLADKVALRNEKESAVVYPKIFKRSERTKPQLQQPSPTVEEFYSSGSNGNASVHVVLPDNREAYVATHTKTCRISDVHHENSEPKGRASQSPPHVTESESVKFESEKTDAIIPTGRIVETELLPQDLDLEATSAEILSQTTYDCKVNKDTQTSALKPVVPLRSGAPTKEKESGFHSLKFLKRPEGSKPKLCQSSPTGGEVSSSMSKRITSMHLVHPDKQKREGFIGTNAQIGKRLDVDSRELSRGLMKGQPGFSGGEMTVKNLRNIGEGANGGSLQDGFKLAVNRRPPDKEVTKENPILAGSKMHIEDPKHLRYIGISCGIMRVACRGKVDHACSIEKATMSMAKENVTSASMGSTWISKTLAVEGVKAGKRSLDVSSLKISRPLGASKDQSNATFQRQSHPLRNLENNMEEQRNFSSKLVHSIANTERKTLSITSLKRKASEESNADQMPLTPQKRLSPSPSKNSFKEPLESIVEEQVYHDDTLALSKTKNVLCYNPNSEVEMARQVNMQEQDIHSAIENDGTVEKAEAYAKELEDICNMLKKKNEEAKETLVRAIVNNNRLLTLNHPMFDEKIRMVERFSQQLTLN